MKNGRYLLPNLFTSANLLCGFLSMIAVSNGHHTQAALAILLAVGLDFLDGKVARMTNSSSAFGVEYDSLADLLSFGMAPGWLLYDWFLRSFTFFGWAAAFFFVICGALRLARFNVQASGAQKYTFIGLPVPAAASVVAAAVLLENAPIMSRFEADWSVGSVIAIYLLAFLMVSNFPYRSLKRISTKRLLSLPVLVGAIFVVIMFLVLPELSFFLITLSYALSGPVEFLLHRKKLKEDILPAEQ